jgi:hypothetical protein
LVIDPTVVVEYSTFYGDVGQDDDVEAIAVDAAGNAYVAGGTTSTRFPTVNALQSYCMGGDYSCSDAFVLKLAADGQSVTYATYYGGSDLEEGTGIAVDAAGNAYITGWTGSTDFPTANALYPNYDGVYDAFVLKLTADGQSKAYATYYGGGSYD